MNADMIAVALLVIAVYCGYLAAKWRNDWSYWSHRCCAAAVMGLGWMALHHHEHEQPQYSFLSELTAAEVSAVEGIANTLKESHDRHTQSTDSPLHHDSRKETGGIESLFASRRTESRVVRTTR